MNFSTKTLLAGLVSLLIFSNLHSANLTIIESQSIHPLHKMDINWQNAANALGHNTSIETQNFLDNLGNLSNTDVLIISSGLIDIPQNRRDVIAAFIAQGGNAYIQSEYLTDLPGNELFVHLVNTHGGTFSWDGELNGNITPMTVIGELANNVNQVNDLTYYWYGTYGNGSENVQPMLQHNNQSWGFIYCPLTPSAGKVITTSDQDWVRTSDSPELLENIVSYLASFQAASAAPTVSIEFLLTEPCNDNPTYTFTATTTETYTSLQWYLNGQAINNATATTYTTSDLTDGDVVECQLSLDVPCGIYKTVSNPILIAPIFAIDTPNFEIISTTTNSCTGEMVTFEAITDTNTAINATYQWLINGNEVNNENNTTFNTNSLSNADQVSCVLTYDTDCTTGQNISSQIITMNILNTLNPQVIITADQSDICSGEMVTFTANGTDLGNNPTFQWQIDGQNTGDNAPFFTTNTLTSGQNINCIITIEQNTCTTTNEANSNNLSINVISTDNPSIAITPSATITCKGEAVSFLATTSNLGDNTNYQWQMNGQNIGDNSPELVIENNDNGQIITCVLTSTDICSNTHIINSNEVSLTVTEIEVEILDLVYEHCGNADGFIEVEGRGGVAPYTYSWMNGSTSSALTDLAMGKMTVTITDANGCQTIGQIEMANLEAPEVDRIETTKADCEGKNGTAQIIMIENDVDYNFEWLNAQGELVSINAEAVRLAPGEYTVNVTNEHGCDVTETVMIEQVSTIQVDLGDDIIIELGETISLEALTNIPATTIEWEVAEGLSCLDCANPSATPLTHTRYIVTVTNEAGCTSTDEILVRVTPKSEVYIPNAFTPNADGINDYFTVFAGDNVQQIKTLRVFDRWGAEIFSNTDFQANNETEGWNGSYRGKNLTTGVYIYLVEVEYIDGRVELHKGDVSITNK